MKRLVMAMVGLCAANAVAMPSQAELKKAQPLVVELMAPAMAEFKEAGAKDKAAAAVKVADASVEFANAAETEAAKFLLLKGAVSYYVRGEAYDKAADAVASLKANVKDVTPAVIAEITGKATGKISETKAPRLFALYRAAKLQVRAASEAKALALKLKKVKSDALQRRYAEALAVSGDWTKAYGEFAKLSDAKLKAIVEAEAKGKAKNAEAGEFWWAYEPAMEDSDDIFKAHAAAFFGQALAAGEITGLKKNIVEQRIKSYGAAAEVAAGGLGSGASPRIPAATSAPAAKAGKAWQEKGNEATLTLKDGVKIEFVKCPAGDFKMLCAYGWEPQSFRARISRPFWITKMRITQQQISSIFPEIERLKPKSGNEKNAVSVAECLGLGLFDRLKEDFANSLPTSCKDYVFRLPSMAEYEYAYHANTHDRKDPYIHIDQKNLSKQDNADMVSLNKKCGENKPNTWGIHDLFSCMTFLDRLDSSI